MSKQVTVVWSGLVLLLAVLTPPRAQAQYAPAPQTYSATVVNSMLGPTITMKVNRDGSHAVIENITTGDNGAPASHTRSYYDLQKGQNFTVDVGNASAGCGGGKFSGDWGDPFEASAGLVKELAAQNPRQTGTETVNGFATKVMEAAVGADKAKVWLDTKYGLAVKVQIGPKTIMEVKSLSLAKPAAALFVVPASCAPVPPAENETFAKETGGKAEDFANAIMPPASPNSCTAILRIVSAGSMQPITSGFQIAIDTNVDPDHPASYTGGNGTSRRAVFSGGSIREITTQFHNGEARIDNFPKQIHVEASFGDAGVASTNVYRQCVSPQTVLLMVLKNPAKIGEGIDWLWVKSGKFAAGK